MGILSKVFKGIKKFFKKVGKGIKKVVKKVGKFADKFGIIGQLGLMFILPHIGAGLMRGLGALGSNLVGSPSLILKGAGAVLNTGLKFATTAGNIYSTVTGAITDFIGTAGKYLGSKLPGGAKPMSLGEAWSSYSGEVMKNVNNIANPFKVDLTVGIPGQTVAEVAKTVGMTPERFRDNYSFPAPIEAGLANLSGDELASYSLDSVVQTGMAPGVSAVTRLSEPYRISRNTDFFGFPTEAPTGKVMTYEQLSKYGTGFPPPPSQVDSFTYGDLSKVGTGEPGSSVSLMADPNALSAEPLKEGYIDHVLKPQLKAAPGQIATQAVTQALMTAAAGDPPTPTYEELSRVGSNYHQDSDTSAAQAIRRNTLAYSAYSAAPIESMLGSNTFPGGSINAYTDYSARLQRGLGLGGPPIYGY